MLTSQISFAQPALLWGLAAVALPVLVHLLLRPRPQRTSFPAIQLLRQALVTGQRANRWRHLLLMLLRAGLLALLALLLAGPTCAPTHSSAPGARDTACVIVLDNSVSMTYRIDEHTTLLDRARDQAVNFVRASSSWPSGSALLVIADADHRTGNHSMKRQMVARIRMAATMAWTVVGVVHLPHAGAACGIPSGSALID